MDSYETEKFVDPFDFDSFVNPSDEDESEEYIVRGEVFRHKFGFFPLYSVQMVNYLNDGHNVCTDNNKTCIQVMLGSGLHVLLSGDDMDSFISIFQNPPSRGLRDHE